MTEQELIEQLADKEHNSWVRFMTYLFSHCEYSSLGSATIPSGLVAQWKNHMMHSYVDMADSAREQVRDEVAHILPIIREYVRGDTTAYEKLNDDQKVARAVSELEKRVDILCNEVFCTYANRPATRNQTLLGDVRELRRMVFSLQEGESKSE